MLIAFSLFVAYLFTTVKKDKITRSKETQVVATTAIKEQLPIAEDQQSNPTDQQLSSITTTPDKEQLHLLFPEDQHLSPVINTPVVKVKEAEREPIPEDQQCALFNWILEEKRKQKPKDNAEEKRINEEKTILEQYIRLKSIPSSVLIEQIRPAIPEYLQSNPEDQQRMLFSWILEEKRKVIPNNHEEEKKLEDEKAILEQLISWRSIPRL